MADLKKAVGLVQILELACVSGKQPRRAMGEHHRGRAWCVGIRQTLSAEVLDSALH